MFEERLYLCSAILKPETSSLEVRHQPKIWNGKPLRPSQNLIYIQRVEGVKLILANFRGTQHVKNKWNP
jgi:hypothetical protein